MAWLSGWRFRKSITLSRASGAVTNYQMRLLVGESSGATGEDVDCGGSCKSDFSDLRFTTSDGQTLLDYYIQDTSGASPNGLADIWIEFDSIGTGATTFYMYYGKSNATAVSSGVNTFVFFEDFNGLSTADLNGQNSWTAHANWDVAANVVYEGAKSVQCAAGGSTIQANHSLTIPSTWNCFMQARCRTTSVTTVSVLQIYLFEGASQVSALSFNASQHAALVAPPAWTNIGFAASSNTWYKWKIAFDAKTTHKTWINETLYTPANVSNMTTITTTIDKIQLENYTNGGTQYVDQIMIGYYLATGPAWGSWGAQESSVIGPFPTFLG